MCKVRGLGISWMLSVGTWHQGTLQSCKYLSKNLTNINCQHFLSLMFVSVSFQMTLLPSYDYQMMPSIMLLPSTSSSSSSSMGKLLSTPLGPVSPAPALASCGQGQLATNCSVESGGEKLDFFCGHCTMAQAMKLRKLRFAKSGQK